MSARIPFNGAIRVVTPADPDWPAGLTDLPDPPAQLLVRGTRPSFRSAVAIVGTRYASEDGLAFARKLARTLSAAGIVVVSGGAAGIDSAAHLGALDGGTPTGAVLATGLIDAYPKQNTKLFAAVARNGVLMCEHDRKPQARGWIFLRRNRLIAALAQALVVVQAPVRSGALATARLAIGLKRRVFAVPSAPWDPRGTGCLQLLRRGAEICSSAADILSLPTLEHAGHGGRFTEAHSPVKDANDLHNLGPSARHVWRHLRRGACHPDGISTALDMKAGEVQEALLTLVLCGLCRQRADGNYVASGS